MATILLIIFFSNVLIIIICIFITSTDKMQLVYTKESKQLNLHAKLIYKCKKNNISVLLSSGIL